MFDDQQKGMFNGEYRFKGRHAERVVRLCSAFDNVSNAILFKRFLDVYINAPLVGFLYGRRSDPDYTKNGAGQVEERKVFAEQVINSSKDLQFNFWLIMLLDSEYEPDEDKRIDKAFKKMGQDPKDEERFDSYVRGGVDVLYEKLMEGDTEPGDYVNRLYDFLSEFNESFNSSIDRGEILRELASNQ